MKLIRQSRLLYDSPDYKAFHDEVRRVFGDVNDGAPGTIGAFFNGPYIASQTSSDAGCSILAAGSLPPPKDETMANGLQYKPCQYTVIWAVYDGNKYQFSTMRETPNKENVIIYVDNASNGNFPGFTDDEKRQLAQFGVKSVNVIRYSRNGKEYQELMGGFVNLNNIPTRSVSGSNYQQTSNSTSTWIGIIVIIILILIVLFIGWKMSKQPQAKIVTERRAA
jgi:hypothetical protein